ncbi:MAG: hypothetical protein QOI26_1353, partial [Pseudonocardiales bacterium]|nr:hypothetical protein [Pseudonocardiales bacterium]
MPSSRTRRIAAVSATAATLAAASVVAAAAAFSSPGATAWTPVANANPKAPGLITSDTLSPQLRQVPLAQGAT